MPWVGPAFSSSSYAIVPPSVPTRRPRRSSSVRNRAASARRTVITSRNSKYGRETTSCARLAGESSTPLIPRSKSPRRTDASIDAQATWTNCGVRPSALRDELGDLDVEAADDGRVGRVGFDVRRAAFRVAAPAQDRAADGPGRAWGGLPACRCPGRLRRRGRRPQQPHGEERGQRPARGCHGVRTRRLIIRYTWPDGSAFVAAANIPGAGWRTGAPGTSGRAPCTWRPRVRFSAATSSASRPTYCCRGCGWESRAGR